MNNSIKYRRKVDDLKAEHRLLGQQLKQEQGRLRDLKQDAEDLDKARALIQQAALQTQEMLRIHLTAIVTTALRAVFQDKDLSFNVEFDSKRGRTEAVLEIGENGIFTNPMESHGGGVVDIASFALRCAFRSISGTRCTMIMDEPFRFLSRNLIDMAADMVKMISNKLDLQIIMVSHIEGFQLVADAVFRVIYEDGISKVINDA